VGGSQPGESDLGHPQAIYMSPKHFLLGACLIMKFMNLLIFHLLLLMGLRFELRASQSCVLPLETHFQSIFHLIILELGVSQTICLIWPQIFILQILGSQVARITKMRHWSPAASAF
jgi:hypothetical protein